MGRLRIWPNRSSATGHPPSPTRILSRNPERRCTGRVVHVGADAFGKEVLEEMVPNGRVDSNDVQVVRRGAVRYRSQGPRSFYPGEEGVVSRRNGVAPFDEPVELFDLG